MVFLDRKVLAASHLLILIAAGVEVPTPANIFHAILLDARIQVALGVDKDLLLVFGVVEAQLVEALAARRAAGLDAAYLGIILVLGVQAVAKIRRHLVGIVDAANDDGLVWVAF